MKIVNTLINSKKSLAFLPHPLGRFVLQLLREKKTAGHCPAIILKWCGN